MSFSDPIADMLTRLRNASAIGMPEVRLPHSRLKAALAAVLKREGFISEATAAKDADKPVLVLSLKYTEPEHTPAIRGLKRVSTPGQRIYVPKQRIPRIQQGFGVSILSTPQGLLTDREARTKGVGGEVVCSIW